MNINNILLLIAVILMIATGYIIHVLIPRKESRR